MLVCQRGAGYAGNQHFVAYHMASSLQPNSLLVDTPTGPERRMQHHRGRHILAWADPTDGTGRHG